MLGGAGLAEAPPARLDTSAILSTPATCCMGWHCCAWAVTLLVMASTVCSRLLPSADSSTVAVWQVVGTANLQMAPLVGIARMAGRPATILLWTAQQMQEAVHMLDKCSAAARLYLGCGDFTLMRFSRGTCGSRLADALRSGNDSTSAAAAAAGGGAADPLGWLGSATFTWPGWLRRRAALPCSA